MVPSSRPDVQVLQMCKQANRWITQRSRTKCSVPQTLRAGQDARCPALPVPQPNSRLAGGCLCGSSKPCLSAKGGPLH